MPTLLRHENFVLTGNWGNFSSQNAVGFNGALKLDQNISLNAGVGVGLDTNRVASRAGFRIGF